MTKDNGIIPIPGLVEEEERDKKLDLERLNTLLDTTAGALQEAAPADLSPVERSLQLARAKRLSGELKGHIEALCADVPETHMVRVRNHDGISEQHEVTFPIYAKGDKPGEYRKIDSEMTEISFSSEKNPHFVDHHEVTKRRINFLNGAGADYWLGRGKYKLDEETFVSETTRIAWEILQLAGVGEDEAGS